jgi:hypothetical protein
MAKTIRPGMVCLPTIEVDYTYSLKEESPVEALNSSAQAARKAESPFSIG